MLKRYHAGTATEGERRIVESWLDEMEPVPGIWPAGENAGAVKQQIWEGISAARAEKRPYGRIRPLVYYPAAAVLLIAGTLVCWLNPMLLSRKVIVMNKSGNETKTLVIGGFELGVKPKSECTIEIPLFGQGEGHIRFCGAVSVVNTSGRGTELYIGSDTGNCEGLPGSDVIHLVKGQTYLAMTDAEYNMISATSDELKDGLPRLFSARLYERFKL